MIPAASSVYDVIGGYILPASIPLLLLKCDIRKIGRESGRLLIAFLIGSAATTCGAILSYVIFHKYIPELSGLAGAFTGTYTGGSANFAAIVSSFDVSPTMQSAALVADNLLGTIYLCVLLAIPSIAFFRKHYAHPYIDKVELNNSGEEGMTLAAAYWKPKEISLKDIIYALAVAFVIVCLSENLAALLENIIPMSNVILELLNTLLSNTWVWLATLTMLFATAAPGFVSNINGAQELGTLAIYLFFFTIGAPSSFVEIVKNAPLLFLFAGLIIIVNLVLCFAIGKVLHLNLEEILIASNANIGGPSTACAMAISKGWGELIGPGILVGTLGYVVGTYLGITIGLLLGA